MIMSCVLISYIYNFIIYDQPLMLIIYISWFAKLHKIDLPMVVLCCLFTPLLVFSYVNHYKRLNAFKIVFLYKYSSNLMMHEYWFFHSFFGQVNFLFLYWYIRIIVSWRIIIFYWAIKAVDLIAHLHLLLRVCLWWPCVFSLMVIKEEEDQRFS